MSKLGGAEKFEVCFYVCQSNYFLRYFFKVIFGEEVGGGGFIMHLIN